MDKTSKEKKEIKLDLTEIQWVLPCAALLLSSKIIELSKKNISVNYIEPTKRSVKDYLKEIGFPLGLNVVLCHSFPNFLPCSCAPS